MSFFRSCFIAVASACLVPVAAGAVWLVFWPSARPIGRRQAAVAIAAGAACAAAASAAAARALSARMEAEAEAFRERARASEERYLREKARVETVIHSLPDGIIMTNLRGDVVYINAPAMAVLGVRKEDVVQAGKGLFELIRQDQLRLSVQQILERHTRAEVIEIPVAGPNGSSLRYYHTTVTLFGIPGGGEMGVLIMMHDVTVDRQLTQMKEEFFHSVAHDLRAPLSAVQGYLRLLEKRVEPDEKSRAFFAAIYQSCEKLTLFIQDILDTYRLEAGQLALNLAALEPPVLLERMKTLYGPVAEEKGIRLEARPPPGGPVRFDGDERLLERVLNNLVSNALKFTPRGGAIRVSASESGRDHVEFSVADTGPGIPKERRALLFEKFTQAGEPREKGGFGLGLSICRKIVELHGGRIWVESEEGKGAEFVFVVPRKGAAVAKA